MSADTPPPHARNQEERLRPGDGALPALEELWRLADALGAEVRAHLGQSDQSDESSRPHPHTPER
ncbi:hypothetical protein [Streptomyces sp. 8N706]|uniref:hypothetical protein n=1 Tax=Streptomyces sp. 8N706 TaxID=3457416 RepID=UPI003FCFD147